MASQLIISLRKRKNLYESKVTALSPAKINLYLNLIGKYPNGYHRIESVVERVSLSDEISITARKNPAIEIFCNRKDLITPDNLCLRAAELIRKTLKIKSGFIIELKKRIPVGAGLGGGSSNAASTILGICGLFGIKLSLKELFSLGARLGSDVNFFLSQARFALIEARGQRVTPLESSLCLSHRLFWPGVFSSTAGVYGNSRVKLTNFFNNVNMIQYALKSADQALLQRMVFNALEDSAVRLYPRVARARDYFYKSGVFSAMSGSGSTFYTFSRGTKDMALDGEKYLFLKSIPRRFKVFNVHTL